MRRSDREVKEFEDIVAIIEKCDVCRIALNNNGYPSIIWSENDRDSYADFWHELLLRIFDVSDPFRNMLWGALILLGAFMFCLGIF